MEIKYVSQPEESKQCGQACLSMITGVPVEDICKELKKYWHTDITKDFIPHLKKHGFKAKLVSKEFMSFDEIPNNSIIRVCWFNSKGHFIVKHNDIYYDPAKGLILEYKCFTKINHYIKFSKK